MTGNNWLIHHDLGLILREGGRLEEAISHYPEAVRIKPDFAGAHNNLRRAVNGAFSLDYGFFISVD